MALMEALASGDLTTLELAVKYANERDIHACILNASARGYEAAVRILLPKAPTSSLRTCAVILSRGGHRQILRFVLAACPDLTEASSAALVQASKQNQILVVNDLVEDRKVDAPSLRRAITSAATRNFVEIVRALIPVTTYDDRKAALISSCAANQQSCASVLISALPARFLDQPLSIAASNGLTMLVKEMLESRDADEITLAAIFHARNIARLKSFWPVVESLSIFLGKNFPGEEDSVELPFILNKSVH
jgi:hypothetical protein